MEQLTGADNVSLFAERRNVFNHVGSLVIYDVNCHWDAATEDRSGPS